MSIVELENELAELKFNESRSSSAKGGIS